MIRINSILLVIGGLSLFLFGLNLMRNSLTAISSTKLKKVIENTTSTKLKSLVIGIVATVLIQSSSAITGIVVALISSQLLDYKKGIMVMIGANVGTTITAFIMTLNIEKYSLLIIVIGTILSLFNNHILKLTANVIIGLGILFLGIYIMNIGFDEIINTGYFINIILTLSNSPFISLISGTIISTIVQSSSVTIAITQSLYYLNTISIKPAICIMLGANVGTTISSLISVISSTKEAKLAVYINILFNIIGVLIFLILLTPFTELFHYLENINIISSKKLTIAYSHLFFNIISTIVFYFIFDKVINIIDNKFKLGLSK